MLRKFRARAVYHPTLAWNTLLGRWLRMRNWWDRIDETLIVGAQPRSGDVPRLAQEGVTAVVNTCEEYAGPIAAYSRHGIRQLCVPTVDFTHPSLEDVIQAVEFIKRETAGGGTVYVHCKAGRARSATVALCWLMYSKGLTPLEAQQLLLQKRPHVNRTIYRRPVVAAFGKYLAAQRDTHQPADAAP